MSQDKEPVVPDEGTGTDVTPTLSRRRFLQGIGATAGVIVAGALPAVITAKAASATDPGTTVFEALPPGGDAENPLGSVLREDQAINYPGKPVYYAPPAGDQKWAMVIDVKACVGCRKCVYACVKENNIGRNSGFTYIQVLEMELGSIDLEAADRVDYEEGGRPDKWYMPVQCMHCAKPTCVYGCPVKATWKEPDGIVVIDYDKCIACRNCMVTCPYDARHFNWVEPEVPEERGQSRRSRSKTRPASSRSARSASSGRARAARPRAPRPARWARASSATSTIPNSEVSILLKTRRVLRLKEELGTEPMIWYVG